METGVFPIRRTWFAETHFADGYTKRWIGLIDWIAWIGADADAEQMYARRPKRLAIFSLSINIM